MEVPLRSLGLCSGHRGSEEGWRRLGKVCLFNSKPGCGSLPTSHTTVGPWASFGYPFPHINQQRHGLTCYMLQCGSLRPFVRLSPCTPTTTLTFPQRIILILGFVGGSDSVILLNVDLPSSSRCDIAGRWRSCLLRQVNRGRRWRGCLSAGAKAVACRGRSCR